MTDKKPTKQAEPAEFPEDEDIEAGAYYDVPDITDVDGKDPSKVYFFASKDGAPTTPGSVGHCKRRGYKVSTLKHEHPDCVLMEIPREKYERRQKARAIRRAQQQKDVMSPPEGLEVLPGSRHGIR